MKLRKTQRVNMTSEITSMDGRRKHTKALKRMWQRVISQAGKRFDVAFEMLSGMIREHNVFGAKLSSEDARAAGAGYGFAKADNEGWSLDPFVQAFSRDLAAAAA